MVCKSLKKMEHFTSFKMSDKVFSLFIARGKNAKQKKNIKEKWKQALRLIRATCIMKQDIIIHKCMTEFAAKDSTWGANLSS